MAAGVRGWRLVCRLVSVLVLVRGTGPIPARLTVLPTTHTTVTTSEPDSSASTSTLSASTSPSVLTSTVPLCPDPHAGRNGQEDCACLGGYKETTDPERKKNNTCRVINGGYLGAQCSDVSQCNYEIHHAVCDMSCKCMKPYVGFNGEATCFDNAMGWSVAIKTAGITVLVLAVGFFIAFGIKGCSRSIRRRLGRRVPWLRRTSDISFNSGDFFMGALGQAILDRPPSYAEEDTDKPPAYEEVFPQQEGVMNAGFSPDSEPESPERQQHQQDRQRVQQQPAVAEAAPLATTAPLPDVSVVSRPAVRGHRRGLSGPAAIHLGSTEQSGQAGTSRETSTTAASELADNTAASERAVTTAPGRGSTAAEEQPKAAPPAQLAATSERTNRVDTPEHTNKTADHEQASVSVTGRIDTTESPERTIETADHEETGMTAVSERTNQKASEQTSKSVVSEHATTAAPERAGTAASEQARLPTPGQNKPAIPEHTSGDSRVNAGQIAGSSDISDSGRASGNSGVSTGHSGQGSGTVETTKSIAAEVPGRPPEPAPVPVSRQSPVAVEVHIKNSYSARSRSDGESVKATRSAEPVDSDSSVRPAEVWEDIQL